MNVCMYVSLIVHMYGASIKRFCSIYVCMYVCYVCSICNVCMYVCMYVQGHTASSVKGTKEEAACAKRGLCDLTEG